MPSVGNAIRHALTRAEDKIADLAAEVMRLELEGLPSGNARMRLSLARQRLRLFRSAMRRVSAPPAQQSHLQDAV